MKRHIAVGIIRDGNTCYDGFTASLQDGEKLLLESSQDGRVWSPIRYPHVLVSCTTLAVIGGGLITHAGGYMATVKGLDRLRATVVPAIVPEDSDEPVFVEVRK